MKLSELQTGEKAVIVRIHGYGPFRKRLIEMGFIQGKEVTVVLNAPLKDPIEYEIIGYKISLRREEAEQIEVVNEVEAREALVSDEHLQGLPDDMDEKDIAKAIVRSAEDRGLGIGPGTGFATSVGKGITCSVGGRTVAIGNLPLMEEVGADTSALEDSYGSLTSEAKTCMFVSLDGRAAGIIAVADPLRPSSEEAVSLIKSMGAMPVMVTGDNRQTAEAVAHAVGITEVKSEVLTQDKLSIVKKYQIMQKTVAMAGDGINDAPALTQANVGMAVGSGTDIAIGAADVVLMNSDPRSVPVAMDIGRKTVSNIKQNLFLAFVYNAICIPIAAGLPYLLGMGEFSHMPMIAAAAMSCSSVSVTLNALRMRGYRPSFAAQ